MQAQQRNQISVDRVLEANEVDVMVAALRTVSARNRVSPRYTTSSRLAGKVNDASSFTIAAHANYRRDDFIFPRTQSLTMREARWEHRERPMRSWSEILAATLIMGIASIAVVIGSGLI
jgi:hypothetical protein